VLAKTPWNTIRWCDFMTNVSVMNQTQQQGICSRIRDGRVSIFGHVRRLQESVPAHEALHLAVNTRAGQRPDDRPDWKRPRGRPRHTWIRQKIIFAYLFILIIVIFENLYFTR